MVAPAGDSSAVGNPDDAGQGDPAGLPWVWLYGLLALATAAGAGIVLRPGYLLRLVLTVWSRWRSSRGGAPPTPPPENNDFAAEAPAPARPPGGEREVEDDETSNHGSPPTPPPDQNVFWAPPDAKAPPRPPGDEDEVEDDDYDEPPGHGAPPTPAPQQNDFAAPPDAKGAPQPPPANPEAQTQPSPPEQPVSSGDEAPQTVAPPFWGAILTWLEAIGAWLLRKLLRAPPASSAGGGVRGVCPLCRDTVYQDEQGCNCGYLHDGNRDEDTNRCWVRGCPGHSDPGHQCVY